ATSSVPCSATARATSRNYSPHRARRARTLSASVSTRETHHPSGGTVVHHRIVIAALSVVAVAACSTEDLAESAIERQLEAEGGGDVDLDLSNGGIRIESEDGSFEMSTDDDGDVTIRGEDVDGETAVIEGSGDGIVVTDGDDTFVAGSGAELPADFPPDFPLPSATLTNVARTEADGQVTFTLVFEAPGDVTVTSYEELAAALTATGYATSFESSDGSSVSAQLSDGVTDVFFSGGYDPGDDFSRFGVTLSPTPG
ncbi:MAG: hypothetical protein ACLGHQ_10075, partial [Acidimicrobiia bacterium]